MLGLSHPERGQGKGQGQSRQRAGLTHPGRCSQALLPSVVKIGAENNKVIVLWDVMRQPCMKHACHHETDGCNLAQQTSLERHACKAKFGQTIASIDSLDVSV